MTIPANRIVNVTPGVLTSGGNGLTLNGLFLTQNTLMPAGKVYNFASSDAVSAFFGPASAEAALAVKYFAGFSRSTQKPSGMLFAFFATANRAASLTSGSLAGLTLTQLQAFDGVLTITVDGVAKTSATIDLSGATSFSNAATLITAGFSGGSAPTVTWDAVNSTFLVTSPTTGSSSSITFATGSLSADLKLTQVLGAFISIGEAADTPAGIMAKVTAITQNFVSVVTMWEPILTDKEAFAVWFSAQSSRYLYLAWDTDVQATVQGSTSCFGYIAKQAAYDGVIALSGDLTYVLPSGATVVAQDISNEAAFLAGMIASINFAQVNGRITAAFKYDGGVVNPTVADDTKSQNLLANGYSFIGVYANASQNFIFFNNGALPGKWAWVDPFVNQVWLNSQFQLALLNLLTNVNAIDYAPDGYGLIRSALQGPIDAALSFGAIKAGVTLSDAEIAEVNQAAGQDVGSIIQTIGYYLQILDPGADARAARRTPIINFWYTDGGAVQQISMDSIDIM